MLEDPLAPELARVRARALRVLEAARECNLPLPVQAALAELQRAVEIGGSVTSQTRTGSGVEPVFEPTSLRRRPSKSAAVRQRREERRLERANATLMVSEPHPDSENRL